jgi:uncharacterized protein YndB with AHSA1/START domain
MSHEHVTPRPGESAPFHFENRWTVPADAKAVWEVLEKVEQWPQWWPGLAAAEPADDYVVPGSRANIVVRTPIGTALRFTIEITQMQPPHLVELAAHGDLRGEGVWTLTEEHGITHVDSLWCVTSRRRMIKMLRPIASFTHGIVMRAGERGLATRLADSQPHS